MKNYDPADHVNYTHLVGEVVSLDYKVRPEKSNFTLCKLKVQTSHRDKLHEPDIFQLIFWDRLADGIEAAGIAIGDTINVEGRLTIRHVGGVVQYSITGNKVKVLRSIPGKEPFLYEIEKTPGGYDD